MNELPNADNGEPAPTPADEGDSSPRSVETGRAAVDGGGSGAAEDALPPRHVTYDKTWGDNPEYAHEAEFGSEDNGEVSAFISEQDKLPSRQDSRTSIWGGSESDATDSGNSEQEVGSQADTGEQTGELEAENPRLDENITRQETVERVAAECGLEGDEQLEALHDAYDVAHDYSGALIVKTAREMLPDLKADVEENPGASIVFVGRDGRSLAAAVRGLDGEFFEEHCSEIVLSRALVETAVQDLELRAGASFPQIEGFRQAAGKVDPSDTVGAYEQLTDYLQDNGIDAGVPGSHTTLVDSSYKGTVQELLSAIYPDTSLKGRYLFFAASPHDPHPGTKFGYALHLEGAAANNGLPVTELPEDPELTFSHKDAIGAIEETLHGPSGSPKRMSESLPEQPRPTTGSRALIRKWCHPVTPTARSVTA